MTHRHKRSVSNATKLNLIPRWHSNPSCYSSEYDSSFCCSQPTRFPRQDETESGKKTFHSRFCQDSAIVCSERTASPSQSVSQTRHLHYEIRCIDVWARRTTHARDRPEPLERTSLRVRSSVTGAEISAEYPLR